MKQKKLDKEYTVVFEYFSGWVCLLKDKHELRIGPNSEIKASKQVGSDKGENAKQK